MSAGYAEPGKLPRPPSLAVDGNTGTSATSCVHTLGSNDREPDWWQVDLGQNYTITDITVYHREGGPDSNPHTQRVAGMWVYVDQTLCYKFPDSVSIGRERKEKDDITCQRPTQGQVVRFSKEGYIHAKHYSFINFCEVQIWVCKPGLYGPQCENTCDSHCQQGRCDNYDGTCDVGCSGGYYGADCSEQCGQCQKQDTCDRHTGRCPHGCQPGYQPLDCQYAFPITTRKTLKTTTISAAQSTMTNGRFPPGVASSTDTSPIVSMPTPSATDHQGGKVEVVDNNSSSSIPGRSDARRHHSDSGNSSSQKYTQGDMAGLAVSMLLLGAVLGVAGLALYCRFFGKRASTSDSIAFRLMDS